MMSFRRLTLQVLIIAAVLVAFIAPSARPAKADDTIILNVTGLTPDNKVYSGKLTIVPAGDLYTMSWDVGSKYDGVGIYDSDNKMLSVGIGNDKCSVAAYVVQDNGTLSGKWTPVGSQKLATEVATPDKAKKDDIDGTYALEGTNTDGSTYQTKLTVTKHDSVYQFTYEGKDSTTEGVGVWVDSVVSVGWGDTSCSVATYNVNEDGSISGLWGAYGVNSVGLEQASVGIDGKYTVKGKGTDGSTYKGDLEITEHGPVYEFSWNNADTIGIGIRQGGTASVAYGDKDCTIIAFKPYTGGLLYGLWGTYGKEKIGFEAAQLKGKSDDGISGDYDVEGIDLDGKGYKGTLSIEPKGDLFTFTWDFNGKQEVGTALKVNDVYSVALGSDKCTTVAYAIDADKNLAGVWHAGGTDVGSEDGTPVK